jgi:hypothetical protein
MTLKLTDGHGAGVWHHDTVGLEQRIPGVEDAVKHRLEQEEIPHPL